MSSRVRDRGSVAVEVVVFVPVLVLIATLVLQLGVAAWASSQTQRAASQSARAQSLGQNPAAAADAALPGILQVGRLEASSERVDLWVDVPRVSMLPTFTVHRQVDMPAEP